MWQTLTCILRKRSRTSQSHILVLPASLRMETFHTLSLWTFHVSLHSPTLKDPSQPVPRLRLHTVPLSKSKSPQEATRQFTEHPNKSSAGGGSSSEGPAGRCNAAWEIATCVFISPQTTRSHDFSQHAWIFMFNTTSLRHIKHHEDTGLPFNFNFITIPEEMTSKYTRQHGNSRRHEVALSK